MVGGGGGGGGGGERKKDPNEVTFRTTSEFLPFWRAVLRYHYVIDLSVIHGYTTTLMDSQEMDGHLQEVALDFNDRMQCLSVGQAACTLVTGNSSSCTRTGQTATSSFRAKT